MTFSSFTFLSAVFQIYELCVDIFKRLGARLISMVVTNLYLKITWTLYILKNTCSSDLSVSLCLQLVHGL